MFPTLLARDSLAHPWPQSTSSPELRISIINIANAESECNGGITKELPSSRNRTLEREFMTPSQ